MSTSQRTQTLLDRLPAHARSADMKNAMIDALGAAETFRSRKAELIGAGTLTVMGQRQALRDELASKHGRAVARAADPVRKARKDITARRDALVIKSVDPTNIAAALERQEVRAWLRTLDLSERQSIAMTTSDRRVLEAMVTAPPELSGFTGNLAAIVDQVEARYMALTYGDELKEIEALDAVVSEAEAALQIARNDLQSVADMNDREFDGVMRPIEQRIGAPWLLQRSGDQSVVVVEVGADGKANYRPAMSNDIAAGVYYRDFAEYQAAQGIELPQQQAA